jgi:acetyl esterase
VDYALSPEATLPVALEQIHAAGRWARSNAAQYGWDPQRIGISGESSGGNLAAAAALLDRERGEVGFAHQALIVPVLDATFSSASWAELGHDYLLTRAQLEWAVQQYAPGVERTEPLLSPLHAGDLSGLPPALIVTGEYDPLRDEGEQYAQRLRAAGVAVTHRRYDGLIHHALMVPRLIDLGRTMLEQTAVAIGDVLRSSGADETAAIVRRARA